MKNVIPILLFFVTSLSYSQVPDKIVSFYEMATGASKGKTTTVFIDDGVNKRREAKIPVLTPLAVIKYFQNQGYKIDTRLMHQNAIEVKYFLFLYKMEEG